MVLYSEAWTQPMLFADHLYLSENKNNGIYLCNWTSFDAHRNDIIQGPVYTLRGQRNWREKGNSCRRTLTCLVLIGTACTQPEYSHTNDATTHRLQRKAR